MTRQPTIGALINCVHSLGRVLATSQVVDDIGVTNALLDGLGVAEVIFLWARQTICTFNRTPRFQVSYNESNTAQITSDLQVTLGHFLTVGDHHIASLGSCGMSVLRPSQAYPDSSPQPTELVDNITTQETGGTKDGRSVA